MRTVSERLQQESRERLRDRHALWAELEGHGATLRVLKGDFEDPLAGSVRVSIPPA